MAEQGTSRSVSVNVLAALTTAQKLIAGVITVKNERELLENAAKEFAQLLRVDYTGMLMSQTDGSARVTGEYPLSAQLEGLIMSPDVRLISEKCVSGQIAMLENIADSGLLSQKAREAFSQAKLKALALLPMGDQNGRWIGAVMLGFIDELTLDINTVDTVSVLARQVGSLVLGVRQVERTGKQVSQLTTLLTLSQVLGGVENEQDLGYEVAKTIATVLPLTQFAMLRGDPHTQTLKLVARWASGGPQKIQPDQPVSLNVGQTLISLIGQTDELVDVPDFSAATPPLQGLLQMANHSGLAAPLRVGEDQVGVVVVESDDIFAYNEADKLVFSQLVAQMNVTLTRLNTSFVLMRSATSSNAVNTVSQQMQSETSAQGVLRGGTLATLHALNATRVSVRLGKPNADANGGNDTYADSNRNGTQKTRG